MSLFTEVLNGYATRIKLENSLQLQKNQHVRPAQIKLEIAHTLNAINGELKDAELKAVYDGITLTV
jgi:hypothetical protein